MGALSSLRCRVRLPTGSPMGKGTDGSGRLFWSATLAQELGRVIPGSTDRGDDATACRRGGPGAGPTVQARN